MEPASSGVGILVALMVVLFAASGLFSSTETALFSLDRVQRRRFAEDRSLRGQLIAHVLKRPRRLLSTILFGNTLVNVSSASVATLLFARLYSDQGVALAIVVDTALVLVFGEILPKTIAVNAAVPISRATIMPLEFFTRLTGPIVNVFDRVSRALLRLLGVPEEAGGALSPSELGLLFEEAGRRKAITPHETRIARNIISFGETTPDEIMTPRVEVIAAPVDIAPSALGKLMIDSRHSRIPIYEGDIDHFLGFVSSKEFLLNADRGVRALVKPVAFFPENAKIPRIFQHMQRHKINMSVIVNEYGETAGILTMEDVFEEVVGEIYDEYEKADELIRQESPGVWLVLARAPIEDVNDACGLSLPDEEAVTLNGYLCDEFGEIPRAGRTLVREGALFTIVEAYKRRIVSVRVERVPGGDPRGREDVSS